MTSPQVQDFNYLIVTQSFMALEWDEVSVKSACQWFKCEVIKQE